MKNNFTLKVFREPTLDKLNSSVNFYFTKNGISIDKIGSNNSKFTSIGNDYVFSFFEIDTDFKSSKSLRVHFFGEFDNLTALTDKFNFFVKSEKLPHNHIIDYGIHNNQKNSTLSGYVFYATPDVTTIK